MLRRVILKQLFPSDIEIYRSFNLKKVCNLLNEIVQKLV